MKTATIALPYITISIATAVEAKSLATLDELPAAKKRIASATTGLNVDLFFYVTQGSQALMAYNEEQTVPQLARKIAEAIKENDLLDDGVGKIYQKIPLEHVRLAEERLRDLPFSDSEINTNRDFFLWVATEGSNLAKKLLKALAAINNPGHDSHAMFTVGHGDSDDAIASFCLRKGNGGRITGNLYHGNRPEMADQQDEDMDGVGGLVLGLMKRSAGLLTKHYSAIVFQRQPKMINPSQWEPNVFTAVLSIPNEVVGWFKDDALVNIINDVIDNSLAKTQEALGKRR